MTYQLQESSVASGHPVELFRFALGMQHWTFTPGQTAVVYQNDTYQPASIKRGNIEQGNDINRAMMEIFMPRDNPLAALFIASPPEGIVSVTLYRYHATDAALETIVLWKGRVGGARLAGSELSLKCEPVASSLKRTGLRARYQLTCRHPLYSAGCGALKKGFASHGTVASVVTVVVQVAVAASQPDGYFVAGMLATADGQRMIIAHVGINLTLISPMPSLAAGQAVTLYAGCDHSTTICKARFANLNNYGGFPFSPVKNPFAGDAIV